MHNWTNVQFAEPTGSELVLTSLVDLSQQINLEIHYRNAMSLPQRTRISVAS